MRPPSDRPTRRTGRELAPDGGIAAALAGLGILLILVSLRKLP